MPLTRLDNLLSSKTGKYLYVSPDDFNATDALDNRGNSPTRPFVSIQRAFLEAARFSYLPGVDNDRFDQFTIMLAPGTHYIDNRPGTDSVEDLPIFQYDAGTGEWSANTNVSFDLSNPNNVLYKFNGRDGGATIPRGTSLVGTDLRRTQVRALYVPDPADKNVPRTALFNVTGGCYFWQFTILDGDLSSNSPLYDSGAGVGKVYSQPYNSAILSVPEYSHHKMTNFVFADKQDLGLLYRKISHVFSQFQPTIDDVYVEGSSTPVTTVWSATTAYNSGDTVLYDGKAYRAASASTNVRPSADKTKWSLLVIRTREFDYRIQENRIVGPLSDAIRIDQVTVTDSNPAGVVTLTIRTKINHGFFPGQYVAITNNGLNTNLNGVFKVATISANDPKVFTYVVPLTAAGLGLISGQTYAINTTPALDANATVQAEVDSVESASPYVFNVSIRSTWGICGIWADGKKATGFKSMVIAQYTGVSLQKDDRAFIRYDEFTNTWNEAPLTDAFATTPYHIKGDAYWKDDWRNFHVRASDDSFIQNVSIFAVGFADHFLLESGGDMSITNSNSNFGNTSMHSKGFKGFSFNQDKGGYITDIIPPKALSSLKINKQTYYTFDVQLTRAPSNTTKMYIGSTTARDPENRPAATIGGYRLGAKRNEKIYINMDATSAKEAELSVSGFKRWSSVLTTLNPAGTGFGVEYNLRQDAANLIDANKTFIQAEAFGYILEKYPYLQNRPYINPNITSDTGRYRDASNLIKANRQEIIDYAFNQMKVAYPSFTVPGNQDQKCKRDIGYIVDAIAADLYDGGNSHMVDATKAYFDNSGAPLTNGLLGEESQSVFAFNRTRDWCKKAISNLLSNKSLLSVTSLTASGTTITVTTSSPHNLKPNDYLTIGGATQTEYNGRYQVLSAGLTATQFRYTSSSAPSISPATGAFYVSTVTIDPKNDDPGVGRFKDALNLINGNRQEIIDRAFAEVSLQYNETAWGTNWVTPGDSASAAYNRFRDAYRLIQQNREEIRDRALLALATAYDESAWGTNWTFPGDTPTQSYSRYWDAVRLIQKNKQIIIETAYATVVGNPPSPAPSNMLSKCKRDLGYFIDAVCMDIEAIGANRYTRKFVQQYFTGNTTLLTNGLFGEVSQSITAFNKARDAMKAAITNTLGSFAGVVTSSPAGGTWQDGTSGSKTVYTDLTITSGPATYNGGGGNIANNNSAACADVRSAVDTLAAIVSSTLTAVDLGTLPAVNNGTLWQSGAIKCLRDLGYFIDAVSLDIAQGGGNKYSRKFVQQYFTNTTTPLVNGLAGEEVQSVIMFNASRDAMKKALTNQLYAKDLTLSAGPATYGGGGGNISVDQSGNGASCADVQSAVDTLSALITTTITAGDLTGLPAETSASLPAGETKCKRDLGYIVDSVAQDLFWGGNEFVVTAVREYFTNAGTLTTNGLSGEITQSVIAFNQAKEQVKKAITNQLYYKNLAISAGGSTYGSSPSQPVSQSGNASSCVDVQAAVDSLFGIVSSTLNAGSLSALPAVNNGQWDCANVRETIDTLTSIITTSITNGNLSSLPARNLGPWSQVSDASKCKRDIGYIIEGFTTDLRVGGNESTINAAEAYYVGTNLTYINNETPETLDAYSYVRDLAISSMRNHNTYLSGVQTTNNSPIITVPSTVGLVIGMKVRSVDAVPASPTSVINFTSTIPDGAYIKRIGDGTNGLSANQIELGAYESKFNIGNTVNATASSSTVKIFVELTNGIWSTTLNPSTDSTVIQDYNYSAAGDPATGAPGGECASVASTLVNYFSIISTILNSGVGSVPRVAGTSSTGALAQRATLFTLTENDSNGLPTTNPHQLETGTPVRLVPRAKPGTTVDKRLIRLPKGFDTNTVYYAIAPGRKTDPYDYSSGGFASSNQQNLLLATSEENAAAGIFIYSPETNSVDDNVEIDVYQYVLDLQYDLLQYQTRLTVGSSSLLETDRPHNFDIPSNNVVPQTVFFRVGTDIPGSSLPTLSSTFGGTTVSSKVLFYVRYVDSKHFTVHQTFADARDNLNPVTFQAGSTSVFYTFANKKRSPLRYDPAIGTDSTDGCWYIDTLSTGNTIIPRTKQADYASRIRTADSYYTRIDDSRSDVDRIYRLRYVIPKNTKVARDPLRGFVLKVRTDEKRRLLPQKILLKPTTTGADTATFFAPNTGERLGLTTTELRTLNPNFTGSTYDPSPAGNPKRVETDSKIAFTIQSARKKTINTKNYLELTVFDVGVDAEAYKTKIFTTVKVTVPQGGTGSFVSGIPISNNTNAITWDGNSSGSAYVHAYFSYDNQYYLILKDISGNSVISYDSETPTVFTQGAVTAVLQEPANGDRDSLLINPYVVEGANVYTMTPGDTLTDDSGISYTIASVTDVSNFDNTYYIFDIETLRRRIPGQQDGVYYLTCLRGDIRPYPTGSGVGENFRNFKFSQPVSKLYPEFYANDPEWYKGIDGTTTTLLDPPPTVSAADNYVHGLVTVNDSKNSVTKETVLDLIQDAALGGYRYQGTNAIQAQSGSASAGSESRKIAISGDSQYPTDGKIYVELRRPSISRSGNHTFEYLGFGPGNYSTGFPARQEIVLSDIQDFYAQAKREDGGIVFYTGLNSNGDLYIGNRKINAITGQETFLEAATLVTSADKNDVVGGIVTTFDTAVTFNQIITVNGASGTQESFFNSPVVISSPTAFGVVENFPAFKIVTGLGSDVGYDPYLEATITGQKTGDIIIAQNRISAAVFDFNARGLQDYRITTGLSNITPNLLNTFGVSTGGPSQLQNTLFGTKYPLASGDIILKGGQTFFSGSLGWIYASDYIRVENRTNGGYSTQVIGIQGNSTGVVVRLYWNTGLTNSTLQITSSSQIRITGAVGTLSTLNGVWPVFSSSSQPFASSNSFVDILVSANLPQYTVVPLPNNGYPVDQTAQPSIVIERSKTAFKEFGVLGSESIRTETETIGDYKLGINTVARSPHSAYQTAFVSTETTPRANLDVVGNTFISGKSILNYLNESSTTKTQTNLDNAFLVGGDSATPNNAAVFRIATTNSGRVGINATNAQLDKAFVVIGQARISDDVLFQGDLEVDGGDITTTSTSFNLLNQSTLTGTLNVSNYAATINIGNTITTAQTVNIGNASTNSVINIGATPVTNTNISQVTIGGAFGNNGTNSSTTINTRLTNIAGNLLIGSRLTGSETLNVGSNAGTVNFLEGVNTVRFAPTSVSVLLGGQGGSTTISNALRVDASITANGNITLNGGLSSYNFDGQRAQFGTTIGAHTGTPSGLPAQNNIDIIRVITGTSTNATFYTNSIDTAGAGDWGSASSYRDATIITGASDAPTTLPPLTNPKWYYLPLNTAPTYGINDYLIIRDSNTGKFFELVRVVSTPRTNYAPYYIVVERQPALGTTLNSTFLPLTNHAQGVSVVKATINFRATWLTNNLDTTPPNDPVSLAEFGGGLSTGDFVIVDRNDAGTTGEIIRINSSSGSTERKLYVNNGAGSNVLEVGSINGTTIVGNPNFTTLSGSITTYGNVNLYTRSDGNSSNNKISAYNDVEINGVTFPTLSFDPYYGDLTLGSKYASLFVVRAALGSSAAAHTTSTPVYVYEQDPLSIQSYGPFTTTRLGIDTSNTIGYTLPIQGNANAFQKGDLIAVGLIANIPAAVGATNFEIMRVTGDPITTAGAQALPIGLTADYPSGGRGQEGTTARAFANNQYVVKINKKTATTTLLKALSASEPVVESPNTNSNKIRIVLANGDLIRTKLDYYDLIRIDNEFFIPDSKAGSVAGQPIIIAKEYYGGGKITTNDSVVINSGSLAMYGSDSSTLIFGVANDDGHAGDGSIEDVNLGLGGGLYLKGTAKIHGDIQLFPDQCIENGRLTTCTTKFEVAGIDGTTRVGAKLTVTGQVRASADSALAVLDIQNLGSAGTNTTGPKSFTMYQDGSIDAFGIKKWWNANGGRRWTYVSTSNAVGNELLPNGNYLVNMPSSGNVVLYLPPSSICQTGDMVRFVEISGRLTYNTSLIIRASKNGTDPVPIQGDTAGTKADSGTSVRTTAWDSGELIVQTRNAAFGLLYVGSVDAYNDPTASAIPSSVRGWWLVEL